MDQFLQYSFASLSNCTFGGSFEHVYENEIFRNVYIEVNAIDIPVTELINFTSNKEKNFHRNAHGFSFGAHGFSFFGNRGNQLIKNSFHNENNY